MKKLGNTLLIICVVLGFSPYLYAETYKETTWDELMPEGWVPEEPVMEEHFAGMSQMVDTPIVEKLNKKKLMLPGYILPIKYDGKAVTEFLLVPYMGACIHVPPPPENQMVYVSLKEPYAVDELWEPVWVSGVMLTQKSLTEYASAGYLMKDAKAIKYEY